MERPHLNDLVEVLRPAFPYLNQEEQKVSVQIHRLLAQGRPLTSQHVADSLQLSVETVNEMLKQWWGIHYDDRDRIIGYWGLSLHPTQHRFEIDGQTLYTWCAWDTLFLPEILQTSARIESRRELGGANVRLLLNPNGLQSVQPSDAVMSFVVPETTKVRKNVVAHFCHYVFFFESRDAGLAWTEKHPGTFLLSIDEAYALGRKINAVQYPDILAKQGTHR